MTAIFAGIGHIIQAFAEIVQGIFSTVFSAFGSAIELVFQAVNGVVALFGGVVGFLLGNIVTIAVVAAAVYGYQIYQKKQGRTVGVKRA